MKNETRAVVLSTRCTEVERALIDAVARLEKVTVSTLVYRLVKQGLKDHLATGRGTNGHR